MSTELVGRMFGSYKLVGLLGRGGMASVYRGYQESIDRTVAIKILPAELLHDPTFLTRFTQEARTLARLTHPAILSLYDFGESNGMPYIVMPFMAGGSLADRLRSGPVSLAETARILTPIADALDFAHSHGILHRDVKPNNILFDQRGSPFLADFGIAKAMESASSLTGTGIIGTPDYMSPEQARGETLGPRSEVYSLGVVAYQMLTGDIVFKATTPVAVIFKHASEPPRPPRELRPDLPEAAEAAILKALAKRPDERFQTATEFVRALAIASEPATAHFATAPVVRATETPTAMLPMPVAAPSQPTPRQTAPAKRGWLGMGLGMAGGMFAVLVVCILAVVGTVFGVAAVSSSSMTSTARFEGTNTAVAYVATATARAEADESTATAQAQRATQAEQTRLAETARAQRTAAAIAEINAAATAAALAEVATAPPSIAASRWSLLALDPLNSNENRWFIGDTDSEFAAGRQEIVDGKYRWNVQTHKDTSWHTWPELEPVSDLYLSVEAKQTEGPATAWHGVMFRKNGNDLYLFFISDDAQKFGVFLNYNGESIALIGPTKTSAIKPGESNRLAVSAQGSHFVFLINDQIVGEVDDSRLSSGLVGLLIQLDAQNEAVFEFDNFELRAPWPVVVSDDFSANVNDWLIGKGDDEYSVNELRIVSGKYRWEMKAKQGFHYRQWPRTGSVSDLSLSVDIRQVSGPDGADYGLVFRDTDDGFYAFSISNTGYFSVQLFSNGVWTPLIDWTTTSTIRPGDVNRLAVVAEGAHLVFFVNDQYVAEVDDDHLSSGMVGVAVDLFDPGDEAVFEFDNFELRAP